MSPRSPEVPLSYEWHLTAESLARSPWMPVGFGVLAAAGALYRIGLGGRPMLAAIVALVVAALGLALAVLGAVRYLGVGIEALLIGVSVTIGGALRLRQFMRHMP